MHLYKFKNVFVGNAMMYLFTKSSKILKAAGQFLCTGSTLTSKACSPILRWHYLQIGSPVHQMAFTE